MCYDFLVKCMFIHGLSAEPEIYQKGGGDWVEEKNNPSGSWGAGGGTCDTGVLSFLPRLLQRSKNIPHYLSNLDYLVHMYVTSSYTYTSLLVSKCMYVEKINALTLKYHNRFLKGVITRKRRNNAKWKGVIMPFAKKTHYNTFFKRLYIIYNVFPTQVLEDRTDPQRLQLQVRRLQRWPRTRKVGFSNRSRHIIAPLLNAISMSMTDPRRLPL